MYLAFTKDIPFTHGHRVTMYFDDVSNLKPRSPVRIAGVNVGQVKTVGRDDGSSQVKVEIELKESALPVHADATARYVRESSSKATLSSISTPARPARPRS